MQCPRDQADVADHSGVSASAGDGARAEASVNRIPGGVFSRESLRCSILLAGHAFLGQPPGTEEVRHEHRGDFRDGREPG